MRRYFAKAREFKKSEVNRGSRRATTFGPLRVPSQIFRRQELDRTNIFCGCLLPVASGPLARPNQSGHITTEIGRRLAERLVE